MSALNVTLPPVKTAVIIIYLSKFYKIFLFTEARWTLRGGLLYNQGPRH